MALPEHSEKPIVLIHLASWNLLCQLIKKAGASLWPQNEVTRKLGFGSTCGT